MVVEFISPVAKKRSLYADFHKDLTVNPLSNDLALKKDEEAIKESMKNLILTDRGERLFQPNIGGDIRATLFENNTPATIKIVQERIKSTIEAFEPRAQLISVEVTSDLNSNALAVKIIFYIRNSETPVSVNIFLERVR
jgi:uncharacterized protein